ncbi:hypothetical protein AAW51_4027 [Caldimonas brevitalea]|uniref:DUF2933 domain-containing protein n=2 Tax=Caldimonas brevitalea TaxID=413882 RepID=A0A0G3BRV7_9BURK|nr:DUF2933 domain-containing protein [Caldimonas brevitalea]AKJ30718.1 hypothetical protein AAW51_4027 [Caldimonas brevitalea]
MKTSSTASSSRARRLLAIAAWLLGAVGAYFLLTRHFDHALQAVPYLLLLACPLMHAFGHRHGQNGHHDAHHAHGNARDKAGDRTGE